MLQDISPINLNNQYVNKRPLQDDYIIITENNQLLLKEENNNITFPKYADISSNVSKIQYLLSAGESSFFFISDTTKECIVNSLIKNGYYFVSLRSIRFKSPKWLVFAGATACQLAFWYSDNKYCGCCGNHLIHSTTERALVCPSCGNIVYPKLCPAVIVGVIKGDKILMTKYADQTVTKRYSLIAGFAEIGETIEQTVQREVMEEVGVKVKNIKYYKSQPWAFTDTLLLGFFCQLDGSENITMDSTELSVAQWVSRDEMPNISDDISLTYEMMSILKNNLPPL